MLRTHLNKFVSRIAVLISSIVIPFTRPRKLVLPRGLSSGEETKYKLGQSTVSAIGETEAGSKGVPAYLKALQWAIAGFLCILSVEVAALEGHELNKKLFDFNLPSQSVAKSLNVLAVQTGAQFLFSYDLAENRIATPVSGRYTLPSAVELLLDGTGLSSGFDKGILTIALASEDAEPENQNLSGSEPVKVNKNLITSVLAFLLGSTTAQGADVGTETSFELDEIIVTATRRETSVQSTALSIKAFDGDALKESGYTNIGQFVDSVPGVTAVSEGPSSTRIIIRNVSTSTQETGSASTATYFDDFAVTIGSAINLVDVQRVEVLKGPQGTLFGRSAMGGIIRYISNKPDTEAFAGGVNTYLANVTDGGTSYGGHAYLNVPISDKFAVRGVGYFYNNAGFLDNLELGLSDVNKEETRGGRLAAHLQATDNLTLDVTYLNQDVNGAAAWVTTTRDAGDLAVGGDEGPDIPFDIEARTNIAGIVQGSAVQSEVLNLKLENSFDGFTATLLATHLLEETSFTFDQREFVGIRYGCICDGVTGDDTGSSINTDLLEFRLVSTGDGFIDWLAGVYYEDTDRDVLQVIQYAGPPAIALGFFPVADGSVQIDTQITSVFNEKAIYGELGFNFSSNTHLTLGYRRSNIQSLQMTTKADGPFSLFSGTTALVGLPFETDENVNTYKVSLEHSFSDDIFVYATASSGYRRGGFNAPTAFTAFSTFDSDSLWNYEFGLKTTWLDGRLVANVAAYRIDYTDIQLTVQDPITFDRFTDNAGKAKVLGVEVGLNYQLTEYLNVSFSGSLSDPELLEDVPGGVSGKKGDKLPGSATENFTIGANWHRPISDGFELYSSIIYKYTGSRLNDFNTDLDPAVLPSYSLADVRFGVKSDAGYSISLYAHNVFDEAIIYVIDRQGPLFESVPTNRPRTIGLNLTYDF